MNYLLLDQDWIMEFKSCQLKTSRWLAEGGGER